MDQEKFKKYCEEIESYECEIMKFNHSDPLKDFTTKDPEEPGYYLTIRLGLAGIHARVNIWQDGHWMAHVADGSKVVARTRKPLEIKNL